ncbi:hypothetical protein PSM7751_02548 [Pseudooceanicola marinus]|uniref:Uncharacterized protein n=1 Tax=Pseudooceanicola marinus TaxID=396013 RepID=A0A1X6ZJY6_9RHOB|nr:hypothetical protein [Pseudooceanicola marinus]SLN53234.1 hypothetical protein PSM7751_02548 [Pseudooceanicola marinus]
MDPILYRPLDVLDERIRRADRYQQNQPRRRVPDPDAPRFYWWPAKPRRRR